MQSIAFSHPKPVELRSQATRKQVKLNSGEPILATKPLLGERYNDAMVYAARLHQYQIRKYGAVPYIAHLQSVSSLVLKNGGNEDEAIAAWLHDAVEDQGGYKTLQAIRTRYGEQVAELVKGCSDSFTTPPQALPQRMKNWWHTHRQQHGLLQSATDFSTEFVRGFNRFLSGQGPLFPEQRLPWKERKTAYIQYLKNEAPPSVLLISACDKLDNARSQLQEYKQHKEEHWNNFTAGREMLQYFDAVLEVYKKRNFNAPVTEELAQVLQEFKTLVEQTSGKPLPSKNIFDGI